MTVSDGSHYATETLFHTKQNTAFKLIRDTATTTIAVEGPFSWISDGDKTESGGEFQKLFALGHQFHALLLDFDSIMGNVRPATGVDFIPPDGSISGDYPFGGIVHLIAGDDPARPLGMVFDFPERGPITTTHADWRRVDGVDFPFQITIDDGERVFDYRYTEVDISPKSPLWFFDALAPPDLDKVQIYRLHRKMLAAHCLGDADIMADLTAPEAIIANRGNVVVTTPAEMRGRFEDLFKQVSYNEYVDLEPPVIMVSDNSDLGWATVKVRTQGEEISSGKSFQHQWAWVMLVKKIDGVWKHAGNASNRAE